jgi:hypothetical protein
MQVIHKEWEVAISNWHPSDEIRADSLLVVVVCDDGANGLQVAATRFLEQKVPSPQHSS